jgi:hypothetical protein
VLESFVAEFEEIEVPKRTLTGPKQDGGNGDVQLVDQLFMQILPDGHCTPLPKSTSLPPAASVTSSRAAWIASVLTHKMSLGGFVYYNHRSDLDGSLCNI